MRRFDPGSRLAACALAGLVWTAASPKLAAEPGSLAPDLFSNDAAWILADRNGDYIPIPGGPSPTRNDPDLCSISGRQWQTSRISERSHLVVAVKPFPATEGRQR